MPLIFANLTIKTRLFVLFGLLAIGMALLAFSGQYTAVVGRGALSTVIEDRVKPLRDLKVVSDMYAVNIVDTAHKLRAGAIAPQAAEKSIGEAQSAIDARWKAYTGTTLTADERRLVDQAASAMRLANDAVKKLIAVIRGGDRPALDQFVVKDLYVSIDPVTDIVGKLVDLQIEVALLEFDAADRTAGKLSVLMIVLAGSSSPPVRRPRQSRLSRADRV